MVIRRSLVAAVSLLLALGMLTATAQRPDHGGGRSPSPEAGTPVVAEGCSGIETYLQDLDGILAGEGPFIEFIFSNVEFEALTKQEAEAIIEDGDAVITELDQLEVPDSYRSGHDGIVLFLQNMIDFVRFYGVDSSNVPDVFAYDDAMVAIYQGEVAIAETCPEAVENLGGYIFMDPATLEDEYGED